MESKFLLIGIVLAMTVLISGCTYNGQTDSSPDYTDFPISPFEWCKEGESIGYENEMDIIGIETFKEEERCHLVTSEGGVAQDIYVDSQAKDYWYSFLYNGELIKYRLVKNVDGSFECTEGDCWAINF